MTNNVVIGGVSQVGITSGLVTTASSGATSAAIVQGSLRTASGKTTNGVPVETVGVSVGGVTKEIGVPSGVVHLLEYGRI